jgi:NAD(P)-dependent dehydrogenase (short-subunit alcohol dehydrogenase family)
MALVTGANRGIGFEIARQIADLGTHDVILSARDLGLAEKAASKIPAKGSKVTATQLDVTREDSVQELARTIRTKYGRLDVLINNAAILIDESDRPSETDLEKVRKTLETNLLGPWRMSQALIPIMKQNGFGRIVNVSSSAGVLESVASDLYAPAYSLSKSSLNVLTMMLAREMRGTNVLVNAMDPGWVRTDMGGPRAPRSVEQGAETAVFLATLPDGGPSGSLFRDKRKIDW